MHLGRTHGAQYPSQPATFRHAAWLGCYVSLHAHAWWLRRLPAPAAAGSLCCWCATCSSQSMPCSRTSEWQSVRGLVYRLIGVDLVGWWGRAGVVSCNLACNQAPHPAIANPALPCLTPCPASCATPTAARFDALCGLLFPLLPCSEATRTYWFNPASLEAEIEYALVGAVLGLAIYNGGWIEIMRAVPLCVWVMTATGPGSGARLRTLHAAMLCHSAPVPSVFRTPTLAPSRPARPGPPLQARCWTSTSPCVCTRSCWGRSLRLRCGRARGLQRRAGQCRAEQRGAAAEQGRQPQRRGFGGVVRTCLALPMHPVAPSRALCSPRVPCAPWAGPEGRVPGAGARPAAAVGLPRRCGERVLPHVSAPTPAPPLPCPAAVRMACAERREAKKGRASGLSMPPVRQRAPRHPLPAPPRLGRTPPLGGLTRSLRLLPSPSFTAEWRFWDELRTEELKPGGADIAVTNANRQVRLGATSCARVPLASDSCCVLEGLHANQNSHNQWQLECALCTSSHPCCLRQEYVQLYTEWLLERSIAAQFSAFRKGFLRVRPGRLGGWAWTLVAAWLAGWGAEQAQLPCLGRGRASAARCCPMPCPATVPTTLHARRSAGLRRAVARPVYPGRAGAADLRAAAP